MSMASAVVALLYLGLVTPWAKPIALTSPGGMRLLRASEYADDHVRLSSHYEAQMNLSFCGPASAIICLNALEIERPASQAHLPYHLFTQENFFTPKVKAVKTHVEVFRKGVNLGELAAMVRCHGVNATATESSRSSIEEFRKQLKATLNQADCFLIVSYNRPGVGQPGGTHISPLAAYDEASDRVLIMDVSRYKFPCAPVWVKCGILWKAMDGTLIVASK